MTTAKPTARLLQSSVLPLLLVCTGCVFGGGGDSNAIEEPAPPLRADGVPTAEEANGLAEETGDAQGSKAADGSEAAAASGEEESNQPEREASRSELLAEANRVVDDWHQAASVADEERYLNHFLPTMVFMGTDPDERWDYRGFEAYVQRAFAPPYNGWTFVPSDRHVMLGPESNVVWLDERLFSETYGTLRGTGVLRRVGASWKIEHYSMTLTIPNGARGGVRAAVDDFLRTSR